MLQKILSHPVVLISSLLTLTVFGVLSLDSIGNPESVEKLIGIQSYSFVPYVLLILLLLRLRFGSMLLKTVSYLCLFIFLAGFVVSAALGLYDWNTFPNASFALTRLNLPQLALLTFTAGTIFFVNQSNQWWKKYWQYFVFVFPFALLLFLLVVRLFPFNLFLELVKEDNIIEYAQFVVLVMGSLFSFWAVARLRTRNLLISAGLIVAGLVFLLIAGDEISWGQRLLGLETAEVLKDTNRQEENTFHNLYAVEWLVIYGYVALSGIGLFSRFLFERIKWLKSLVKFTPSHLLLGYFLVPFVYFLTQMLIMWGRWHAWSEVAELYLYTALVLWVVTFGFREFSPRLKK